MLVSAARGWAYFGVDGHKLDQMHRVYVRAGENQVCLLTKMALLNTIVSLPASNVHTWHEKFLPTAYGMVLRRVEFSSSLLGTFRTFSILKANYLKDLLLEHFTIYEFCIYSVHLVEKTTTPWTFML